jgi:hypothetical protein
MPAPRHVYISFVIAAALACGAAEAADGDRMAASDAKSSDAPVACRTDAECPHLACGPCTAGAPITQSMLGGPECAVNPCLDASAICNEQHTCEIGPRTRKNPAVWKKPPP